jgi:ADP-ribose pyrophosphatase YjhB (NUDIX family)
MKGPRLPRQRWSRKPVTKIKESKKTYRRRKKVNWQEEMGPKNTFRFCPLCSAELTERKMDNKIRLVCPVCGYVNYNNPVPACAVILEREEKILLCQRKFPPYPEGWTLPSGFLEADETPQQCAQREAKEETNLEVEIGEVFGVYAAGDDPRAKVTLIVFLGRITGGQARPGDDAKALGFFSQPEIPSDLAFLAHRQVLKEYFRRKSDHSLSGPPT